MNLTCSTLSKHDIEYVVERTWARGEEEAIVCGVEDKKAWVQRFTDMAVEYGFVLRLEGEAVAVLGATQIRDVYYTFFAATDVFERIGRRATLFLVKFLKARVAERPGVRLELGSACNHPKAREWFEVLGFELIERQGLLSRYVYKRKLT